MHETSRALKLEDYEEITFDPDMNENRMRRDTSTDVKNRGKDADDDDDDEIDSTTVESSTIPMKFEQDFLPTSTMNLQQQQIYAPYPPSRGPSAQHVAITHSPHYLQPPPYIPQPIKNHYEFHPSQLDYNNLPYCINPIHHKFTPIVQNTWSNYRKWK